MALEGNLSSFGLSEILQLIAVQKKTGMLTVNNDDRAVVMFFRNGEIVSTRDRRRRGNDPFRDYLTRYGVLGREQLVRITQIASQSKLDLIDIISSEGFMTEKELRSHWRKQIQETMHDILTWEQCSYKFITNEEIVAGIKTTGELNIEAMLMESMRRIDEFSRHLSEFPSDQILVTRLDTKYEGKEALTENEKSMLDILTDIIAIKDLISKARMPVYEVYETLKALKDKDLIKAKDERAAGDPTAGAEGRKARVGRTVGNVIPVVVAFIAFLGAGAFGLRGAVRAVVARDIPEITILQADEVARARFEQRLRWTIEAYRAENGSYPPSLDALKGSGLADALLVDEAQQMGFRYRLTPGRAAYTLL